MSVSSRTATVGQPAPDFRLADQHGDEFHLTDAVKDGPMVVVFLRGFT
jgi:peroxiredoxin